jgi:DNA-binding transcriptional regulator YdaS (Cro superfamily)
MKYPAGTFTNSGPWLAKQMEMAGLTHAALARSLDVHFQNVSNWTRGVAKVPPKYVRAICKRLTDNQFDAKILELALVEQIINDERDRILNHITD